MIRITSKAAGFRRAGIAHPAEPTSYTNDTFTDQQLALLKAEPMLVVEEIEDKPVDEEPAEKPAKKATGKTADSKGGE